MNALPQEFDAAMTKRIIQNRSSIEKEASEQWENVSLSLLNANKVRTTKAYIQNSDKRRKSNDWPEISVRALYQKAGLISSGHENSLLNGGFQFLLQDHASQVLEIWTICIYTNV